MSYHYFPRRCDTLAKNHDKSHNFLLESTDKIAPVWATCCKHATTGSLSVTVALELHFDILMKWLLWCAFIKNRVAGLSLCLWACFDFSDTLNDAQREQPFYLGLKGGQLWSVLLSIFDISKLIFLKCLWNQNLLQRTLVPQCFVGTL